MKKKLMFILAGILCAVSLTSCNSSAPSSEKEAAKGDGDQEKMVVAVSDAQKGFYRMAASKYSKLHPETEIEIVEVPEIDNAPTEKMEKNKKAVKDLQVQVMAGKGPDVFLLDENNQVLPDMIKSSSNGLFLDLNTVVEGLKDMPLNQTVLKAGEVDGKQYFLPLGYMIMGVATADDMVGDWTPSSGQPGEFLKEAAEQLGVEGFPTEFWLRDYLSGLFGTSFLDYEEKSITFSKELQDFTELLDERKSLSFENASELPDVTVMGHYRASSFEMLVQRSLASGTDVRFLPFPNGEGGVNAQVNVFAAVRANSSYASQAGDFLAFLLSDEMQGGTGWKDLGTGNKPTAIPINNNAFVPAYQYRFSDGSEESQEAAAKKAEELFEVVQQVTTARFCQYENTLIYNGVFMTSESSSVEKKLDDLKNELRFYFDE